MCHHNEDFELSAEWHFSATSHGKGACDGFGGTVKRLAARTSLQRPYEQQIMTPRQLFDWATISISAVTFEYCTIEDYEREQHFLEQRFLTSQTIQGSLSSRQEYQLILQATHRHQAANHHAFHSELER